MGKISCDSCGKPMHGGGKKDQFTGNEYCEDCIGSEGRLKDYYVVKEKMVLFYMDKYDYPRSGAEQVVIGQLKMMPAWEKRTKW